MTVTMLDMVGNFMGYHYAVLAADNGKFYAVRDETPYFCFESDSRNEVIGVATKAIKFYVERQSVNEQQAAEKSK